MVKKLHFTGSLKRSLRGRQDRTRIPSAEGLVIGIGVMDATDRVTVEPDAILEEGVGDLWGQPAPLIRMKDGGDVPAVVRDHFLIHWRPFEIRRGARSHPAVPVQRRIFGWL